MPIIKELINFTVLKIFSTEENYRISIKNEEKILSIFLKDIWIDAINYLWENVNIDLYYLKEINNNIYLDIDGYLILESNTLVSPSDIGNVDNCVRKYYINKRIGKTIANYEMMRGTLVNNAFDLLVENKIKKSEDIINKVLEDKIIDIATLEEQANKNYITLKNELHSNLNSLKLWESNNKVRTALEKNTEPSFISNKYGLSGRIDLLASTGDDYITYELKTTKAPDNLPWQSHKQQVASYQLLLESALSCTNPESYMIYSRGKTNQLVKECYIDKNFRRHIINIRNKIVAIDYALTKDYESDTYKRIIPKAGLAKEECSKCFKKNECHSIASLLNEEVINNFPQIDNSFILDKETLNYYHKYFRMIELERLESRKFFSKIFNNKEELLETGKLIENLEFKQIKEKELYLISNKVLESEIKKGDIVIIYTDEINKCEILKASIKDIDKYNIYIDLKKEYSEDFFKNKKWSIFIDFMETSYNVMNSALYKLVTNSTKIKDFILGNIKPTFKKIDESIEVNNTLNNTQKDAIKKALSCNNYLLIQGPPGTGKTHTLSYLIQELIKKGEKVLLSAFTHKSIDNVLLKLIEHGFDNFLRIGNHEVVEKRIHPYLVQEKFNNKKYDEIKEIKKEINNYPLIACTSISAISSSLIKSLNFSISVIDEAGQLNEPSTISIILNAEKFILIGDHLQLPPVIQSMEAKAEGFDKSLFERLINLNKDNEEVLITLDEQYRMNKNIMKFSNENFYKNKLKTPDKIANQKINIGNNNDDNIIFNPEKNIIFINISKIGNYKNNKYEANLVSDIAFSFYKRGIYLNQIGIISPFRSQVAEIKREIIGKFDSNILDELVVDTVDRFQGNDRDIIIFSSVISKIEHLTDFFNDKRRLNVTVTRSKKKFIIIGNYNILSKSELFSKFLEYCEIIDY